jgi:hypothetical protein
MKGVLAMASLLAQGAFGLADEAFLEGKTVDGSAQVVRKVLKDDKFMGMILDGPARVEIDKWETVPLAGVRKSSFEQNYDLPLEPRAILVAASVETGDVFAGPAFEHKDELTPRPPRPPEFPEGENVKPFSIDVRKRLPTLPWRPGTLAFTVLLYDHRSNSVISRLEHKATKDPEVARYLEAQKLPKFPQPASPDEGDDVSYALRPGSPDVPARPGIALAIDRVAVDLPKARAVLHGSFRLPVGDGERVRPRPEGPGADRWHDVGDAKATAILPITLVITGDSDLGPWVEHLRVPSRVPLLTEGKQTWAVGHFHIDLLRAPDPVRQYQSYAVWAVSGDILSEPVKVSIISPDSVPQ